MIVTVHGPIGMHIFICAWPFLSMHIKWRFSSVQFHILSCSKTHAVQIFVGRGTLYMVLRKIGYDL